MKPRNDTQREVLRLSSALPVMEEGDLHFNWEDKEMEIVDYISYNSSYYCDGQWWDCGYSNTDYYAYLVKVGDYQVIRYYAFDAHKVGTRNNWYLANNFDEIAQRWFKDGKQVAFVARKAHNNHYHWCFNTPMAIRKDYDFGTLEQTIVHSMHDKAFAWGLQKYTQTWEHSGMRDDSFTFTPFGEFLYKCEPKLYAYAQEEGVEELARFEDSIRVAHRHKYPFDDVNLWVDYIRQLEELGRDLRNPLIICPKDLEQAHNITEIKIERKREMEALTKKPSAKEMEEWKKYPKKMGALLGIVIVSEHTTIKPLQSVEEFRAEGEVMHHCVYTNGYYKKDDRLILSARDNDGKRSATIEVNLKTGTIVQCRAKCNGVSQYQKEIEQAINDYMPTILSINKQMKRTNRVAA